MGAPRGNKYALGNKGGRPRVYSVPKKLSEAVNDYFIYIKGEEKEVKRKVINEKTQKIEVFKEKIVVRESEPATITGLTLFLGFAHRQSLSEYEQKKEFSDIIKNAKTRVEFEYEKRLHGDKNVGAIFALKNMGWKDSQQTEISGELSIKQITGMEIK